MTTAKVNTVCKVKLYRNLKVCCVTSDYGCKSVYISAIVGTGAIQCKIKDFNNQYSNYKMMSYITESWL